jgi:hypothetical protein
MKLKCKIHDVALICYCPTCRASVRSERKAEASRQNGKLGGRPQKPWSELGAAGKRARRRRREQKGGK